jgi:hypothetical protein
MYVALQPAPSPYVQASSTVSLPRMKTQRAQWWRGPNLKACSVHDSPLSSFFFGVGWFWGRTAQLTPRVGVCGAAQLAPREDDEDDEEEAVESEEVEEVEEAELENELAERFFLRRD